MKLMDICIPTYEMGDMGDVFLEHSFKLLERQTFKDFNVIISDHSINDSIKNLCRKYENILNINYIRNIENLGNSSANINNAIKHSKSLLIKILFQDDFLFCEYSLEFIVNNFNIEKDKWFITSSEHSHDGVNFNRRFTPQYNDNIHIGNNTISSPSVLTILNDNPLLFDENLIWLMDCDYYKRCFNLFGLPKILDVVTVVNRVGPHQVSNTLVTNIIKDNELKYTTNKIYGNVSN